MGDVNVGSFFFYHLHVMHTLTAAVLATAAAALASECTPADGAVFNSQAEKCRVAAKLPTDLTVQDMLNACAFPACVTWYNQLATLPCTVGGKPSSTMGQICGGKSAPASSSGKYCTASDYSSATNQLALSCALDSGISTTALHPTKLAYAALTCLDATGKPASDFAKFCAATTTAAPTTTKKPTTTAAPTTTATADPTVGFLTTLTPQSTAKDMPYYYPEEYNACLRAAGLTSIPSALSDITKLCQYDVYVEVFEMYRHVFCKVNGSRTMGYVCVGYTKSDPFLVPQNNSITLVQSTSSLPSLSIAACLTSTIVILLAF
ncbi:hypothetical protein AeMF1_001412 [Aphanomyces euteiches]|nr:hypothetical protein AeMF1_001412 [Aphanomyces euteiches]KAH9131429.1 hypothetical protein AeNC1_019646 [Aphanomyces euteiches]